MNILRVNVAIPVPSRYSFVKKACVTLTSSDSSYCYVPCGPISALQYLTAFNYNRLQHSHVTRFGRLTLCTHHPATQCLLGDSCVHA